MGREREKVVGNTLERPISGSGNSSCPTEVRSELREERRQRWEAVTAAAIHTGVWPSTLPSAGTASPERASAPSCGLSPSSVFFFLKKKKSWCEIVVGFRFWGVLAWSFWDFSCAIFCRFGSRVEYFDGLCRVLKMFSFFFYRILDRNGCLMGNKSFLVWIYYFIW